MTGAPIDETGGNDRAARVAKLRADVLAVTEAVGGYSVKAEARRTGASVHFKFGNTVDPMDVSMRFVQIVQAAPDLIEALTAYIQELEQ